MLDIRLLRDNPEAVAVAQATLSSERGLTLMELSYRLRGALSRVAKLIRDHGHENDQGVLRDFGALVTQVDVVCAIADQFLDNRIKGVENIGDASIVKNSYSRVKRSRLNSPPRSINSSGWDAHHSWRIALCARRALATSSCRRSLLQMIRTRP